MGKSLRRFVARRPGWVLVNLMLIATVIGIALLARPTSLTIAVAPAGGTEPALVRAFAQALDAGRKGVRLRVVPHPGVSESAAALEAGEVDLAIVRPDVAMPGNGLTLAVLRELAALVVAPGKEMKELSDLGGKRLGLLSNRSADPAFFTKILGHLGLELRTVGDGVVPDEAVGLVTIEEHEVEAALRDKRIDAIALSTTPTTPAARRIVEAVRVASTGREATLLAPTDVPALVARFPRLQSVTVPAGLFGGDPKLPAEELVTIGASHRLMARSSLARSSAAVVTQRLFELRARLAASVPAADDMTQPPYDDTAEATTARMPIHPGALDYFEREQESLLERYESVIYLVAILGGSVVSAIAWLRSRIGQARRERINVAAARLLRLRSEASRETDPVRLARMEEEVDAVAASIARRALARPTEPRTLEAAAIAVEAARSTVRRAAEQAKAAGWPGRAPES